MKNSKFSLNSEFFEEKDRFKFYNPLKFMSIFEIIMKSKAGKYH